MLRSLSIKQYALIDNLSIGFAGGLTILTGETGAGKSIILGALGMILGERASSEAVRAGADKAVVEGEFSDGETAVIKRFLETHNLDQSPTLILRREIPPKGGGRCFINDTPVPLSVLRQTGDLLVDLHGQHDHQSLLRTETHIEVLDSFGGLEEEVRDYRTWYDRLSTLVKERSETTRRAAEMKEQKEVFRFQLKEIDEAAPQEGEDDSLTEEERRLENHEKIFALIEELSDLLYDGDQSVFELLARAHDRLASLSEFDNKMEPLSAEGEGAKAVVEEIARSLRDYRATMDFSHDRLEEIRNRLGQLSLLKKKYGGSIAAVMGRRNELSEGLQLSDNLDETLSRIESEIVDVQGECGTRAKSLSEKRTSLARKIEKEIVQILAKLGITKATFAVGITGETQENGEDPYTIPWDDGTMRIHERGADKVEFQISTNAGEEARPLARIASGGEISRVMLALKTILAKRDRLPVVVFDEIDVGVSGRIAGAVGRSLKRLSESLQVIVITHLPQIAALADDHIAVYKTESGGRTTTTFRKLGPEERVEEVAGLLSGRKITEVSLMGARELIGSS